MGVARWWSRIQNDLCMQQEENESKQEKNNSWEGLMNAC